MICGHDRETLRHALEFANSSNLDTVSRGWSRPQGDEGLVLFDVHNPAKLAAIIAELMRERGFDMMLVGIAAENVIHAHVQTTTIHRWLMPKARAFALRLLDATTTAQDIERMIGEL